jgi:putative hemolysin
LVIPFALLLIPLLLLVAAIFAAAEASLFSLSRPDLETIRSQHPGICRRILLLLKKPDELLSTLIIGNEAINIVLGALVVATLELYLTTMSDEWVGFIAVMVSSLLMLMFSEILPKVLAFRLPRVVASVLVYPTQLAHLLLSPLRKIFLSISGKILQTFGIEAQAPAAISETDFKTLVEVGAETGSLDREEKQLIYNVFDFSDHPVSSVMTPWNQVVTIDADLGIKEILQRVRQRTFSRVPILAPQDNRVVGILYTKELLRFLLQPQSVDEKQALEEAIFAPYIVSTHKKISTLFREFKLKKIHIALVVDEYGRNLGVVTLEDLLNALFRTSRKTSPETVQGGAQ